MRIRVFYTLATLLFIVTLSTLLILYAKGYSLDINDGTLKRSGILLIKSIPDGAKIFKNGKLVDVTNTSLANLEPKTYKIRLEKEGYRSWDKEVLIKEELVTEIKALLVVKTPSLTPLTNTGIINPTFSNYGDNIIYYSSSKGKTGLWFMPLTGSNASFISRNTPRLIASDPSGEIFTESKVLAFSPDNDQVLISLGKDKEEKVFLLSTEKLNKEPLETPSDTESIMKSWGEEIEKERKQLVKRLKIEPEMKEWALQRTSRFSPDQTKFLYSFEESNEVEYRVYNTTKPLGVGGKADNLVLRTNKDRELTITWHADNRHLIIVEEEKINLIEIDGCNQTLVFNGLLSSQNVYPTPDGNGLIALTTFSSFEEPNLYVIRLN